MKPRAYVNATLYPVSRPPIEKGLLLVRDGKIVFAGRGEVPAEAEIIDMSGKVILPGFVDAHTHVGMWGEW